MESSQANQKKWFSQYHGYFQHFLLLVFPPGGHGNMEGRAKQSNPAQELPLVPLRQLRRTRLSGIIPKRFNYELFFLKKNVSILPVQNTELYKLKVLWRKLTMFKK